jgi:RNA polymerase sigma-70 factor (ECF subfamily)
VDSRPPETAHGHRAAGPFPPGLDERRLVASILNRDRKAAAAFVAAHIDAIYGYARHRLAPNLDLVDDVVQDVFLAALNGLSTFKGQSSLRTWLVAIARHKVEDVYRRRLRDLLPLDDLEQDGREPAAAAPPLEEQLELAQAQARTRAVLSQLPERYGLILLWRYWEQRSTQEMAVALGTSEKSVERTLWRARARFKELWAKEQADDR